MKFSNFLLNETKAYLGQRIGDILTALQNLQDDADDLGQRAMERALLNVVSQIRKILHGRWDDTDNKDLLVLQKVGVGIMRGLDETEVNMKELVTSAVGELERLSGDMDEPLNDLGSEESAVDSAKDDSLNYLSGEVDTE